jgi:hypothetical protein
MEPEGSLPKQDRILSLMNPVYIVTIYFFQIHFNIIFS